MAAAPRLTTAFDKTRSTLTDAGHPNTPGA